MLSCYLLCMAYKHQTNSYRGGGKWICWSDGLIQAQQIATEIRAMGFKVKREGTRIFVLANEVEDLERMVAEQDQ